MAEPAITIYVSRLNYYLAYLISVFTFIFAGWLARSEFNHAAALAGLLVIGTAIIVIIEIFVRNTTLQLTSTNVLHKTGVLSKNTRIIHYIKITDVEIKQSILQRIFRIGDVQINTAGTAEQEVSFANITNPNYVYEFLTRKIKLHHARQT